MSKRWFGRIRSAALAVFGLVVCVSVAAARPKPGVVRHTSLFAGFLGRMNVNRWDCGLDATGHVCVDPGGSTTVGGGFWPKGTPDQYVFGSGIQIAGVVDPSLTSFPWHGDTTAAFFEDPSGQHENGSPLSLIWTSTNSADLATWPRDAYVPNDTSLYAPVLIGKKTASQEDVWARYWDGDPNKNSGRPHPLGVLVNERGLAWNFPSGNEDIQYWIFTVTNITASKTTVYAGRPDQDSLTSLGQQFASAVSASYKVTLPDTGYTISNAYFAFAIDADVEASGATQNFTTANLPFNMGIAFKSDWDAPDFQYPTATGIWSAPFAKTVGEVGVKYLRSPFVDPSNPALGEIGLVLYSGTVNAGAFGDAANAAQVYRYMKGTLDPSKGDAPCNYAPSQPPTAVHICYIPTSPVDIRFFQSSGPFTLKPGQSQTIAVAYIAAAPVDNPAIKNHPVTFPTGGPIGTFKAEQPESLAAGTQHLNTLDSIFGALTIVGDTGGGPKPAGGPNGKIDQNEITVVPRSLLGKGLVAQAVFDAHFLLPFPPDPPDFFLIPGDNQVTVVWKASPTETTGDPYFAVASNTTSPLYDPDYREFDVEGYRIYRGRTSGDLAVIAQFDKTGTTFIDYTGELSFPNCAPELGVETGCPVPFDTAPPFTKSDTVPLVGDIVQIPPGGRVKLADSTILVVSADTAVSGAGSGSHGRLTDTGVPFAFVDKEVLNGFTYFYTVAAFDVNSIKSTGVGATSLEGKFPAKSVVPRKNSSQVNQGTLTVSLAGAGGAALTAGAVPALAKATGIFAGPMPPTNGFTIGFPAFLPAVVTKDSVTVTIDSVVAGNADPDGLGTLAPALYYMRAQGPFKPDTIVLPLQLDAFDADAVPAHVNLPPIKFNQKLATVFGGDTTYALLPEVTLNAPGTYRLASWGRASVNSAPANADFNGPRWWAGAANENTNDPNGVLCSPSAGGCVEADLSRNAGAIAGVSIFHPQGYSTVNNIPMRDIEAIGSSVFRAADFRLYWGASAGTVDSVVDVTHKVKVPFKSVMGPSWGFLTPASFATVAAASTPDGNNGLLTWTDISCVEPAPTMLAGIAGNMCTGSAPLVNTATLSPVVFKASTFANAATLNATTGNGFILYINGHFFLMQMAALPTSTVWNVRFYAGNIVGDATAGYTFQGATRPPAVPGLTAKAVFTSTTFNAAVTTDSALAKIHTVPDPYYVTNAFESSPNQKVVKFVNLPSQCIVRIYSLSGVLVKMLAVNDATGGAETQWDLRNRNNQFVASGVYFWHVETADGKSKVGRFTIINFAK